MTADEIIAANPEIEWRHHNLGKQPALIGKYPDGSEMLVIWNGEVHAACEWPLKRGLERLRQNLRDAQPGKEFATVYDDRLADKLRKGGLTAYRRADGSVTGIKPEGVSP